MVHPCKQKERFGSVFAVKLGPVGSDDLAPMESKLGDVFGECILVWK
jgi:hypothetical protein